MRFYNRQHRYYCGIDLHVKTMYVCILDGTGQVLVHSQRAIDAGGVSCGRRAVPDRPCRGGGVHVHVVLARGCLRGRGHRLRARTRAGDEGHPRWEGEERQDRLAQDRGLAPGRHAAASLRLSGSHAVHARSDPSALAPRAEAGSAPGPHPEHARRNTTYPSFGRKLAYKANRDGVVEHFSDPSVQKSIEVDLALIDHYDALVTDLELTIVREAKRHDAEAFHRLRSVPGIGKVLALTILLRDSRHHAL